MNTQGRSALNHPHFPTPLLLRSHKHPPGTCRLDLPRVTAPSKNKNTVSPFLAHKDPPHKQKIIFRLIGSCMI